MRVRDKRPDIVSSLSCWNCKPGLGRNDPKVVDHLGVAQVRRCWIEALVCWPVGGTSGQQRSNVGFGSVAYQYCALGRGEGERLAGKLEDASQWLSTDWIKLEPALTVLLIAAALASAANATKLVSENRMVVEVVLGEEQRMGGRREVRRSTG